MVIQKQLTQKKIYRHLEARQTLTLPGSSLIDSAGHYDIKTALDAKTVRINSRDYAQVSGNSIGFQAKPGQNVSSSGNVIGAEISPRVNSGIALTGSGSIIGLHVDAFLKGTAAGTIAGDVRGLQVELVTDDAGTRTISGNVSAIRVRAAFSATTITGIFSALRVEKAETQTNSKQFTHLLDLTGDNGLIWKDDYTTEPITASGAIKVRVNGADRWIQLFSGAPAV